jgi:two-component system cell cycle sensor histidine kinase/response regulator CckA
MAHESDIPRGAPIDRSDRPGHMGLLLLLAAVVAGVIVARFLGFQQAQPFILGLLLFFAVAGLFFLFAWAMGIIQFAGQGARNDITKLLVDAAGEGVSVVDDDGRIVYANEAYAALAGTPSGDVRTVERLFTGAPEVSEAIYRLAQAAREQRTRTEEIRLSPALAGAQEFGWYRVRVRPLPRPGGRQAAVWTIADVTHERERQENVFQELQHAIDYLDHAPAGFLSVDPDGSIVYLNATLATWLDYDLAQVGSGGLTLSDVVPRNVVSMMTSISGEPGDVRTETFDLDLRRRAGQLLPVRLYHRVAFGQDGRPGPSRTLVLNRSPGLDVGEGQRAAEVRFTRFFHNTPVAIATLNRGGRVVQANASFSKLFGTLPRSGDPGDGLAIASAFRAGEGAQLDAALHAAAESPSDIQPLELHVAGEPERSVRVWITPVADADAGESGETAILYALDTTDLRLIQEQLAQSQKMNAVGQLAGGVAHDFNNVLQAIIGYSDLLLANHRPTDPSFQDIMQIKQNANRAASLVRQLLAFSRRQTLRPEVLNLVDRLSDLSMLLKRLLGERVELEPGHARDLWPVKADVNQFEQVIVNLAVNARDAMPSGGKLTIRTANVTAVEAARLNVSGMPPADYVVVEVSDTGIGMSPEVKEKIFERARALDGVRHREAVRRLHRRRFGARAGHDLPDLSPAPCAERRGRRRGGPARSPQAGAGSHRPGHHPPRRGRGSGQGRQRTGAVRARLHGAGSRVGDRGAADHRAARRARRPRGLRRRDARDGRPDAARRTAQALSGPQGDLRLGLRRGRVQEEPPRGRGLQLPRQALQPAPARRDREAGDRRVGAPAMAGPNPGDDR